MQFKYLRDDFFISRYQSFEKESEYILHNHMNKCEILYFIKGNSTFVVEGTQYPLSPHDIIIARHDEMHRVIHHAEGEYDRVVINFDIDFFENYQLQEYAPAFFNRPAGSSNLYSARTFPAVTDCLERLCGYCREDAPEVLVRGVFCELLRIFAKPETPPDEGNVTSPRLREIILYINDNLSSDLSLDFLSKKFYISKYHLCRIFKEQTGMTLGQFITKKKMLKADALHSSGMSLTDAACASGFSDYSSFYHARKRYRYP